MKSSVKYLTVVRHAKSSWDYPNLTDHARPLNDRGLRDAPRMAQLYAAEVDQPDLVISSTAVRAKETAGYFIDALSVNKSLIQYTERLYHAGPQEILSVLSEAPLDSKHVMIVGHNPGFTSFVNRMTGERFDNIPTCGVAVIRLRLNAWKEIRMGIGQLDQYYYPKGDLGKHRI
ncbi:SixA phosphatase family protein [Reichenbachiella ulvae]|uniref:Histidine phosphatase family protein n=1 Tax=Reichenbachiella ulvae TaxID=2980104 RepID=A0ABT3CQ39_9BACT|nr:histidine phosphatase family protein [Reichenbachiella ulvae]MCV9385732.1 histidine phosphatase family protein [Reichenbachiella ulvae]